jgi:hypothetical protein
MIRSECDWISAVSVTAAIGKIINMIHITSTARINSISCVYVIVPVSDIDDGRLHVFCPAALKKLNDTLCPSGG